MRKNNKTLITSTLRRAARYLYHHGEKVLALELITICINFLDRGSHQYFLAYRDWHFYDSGDKVNYTQLSFQRKIPNYADPMNKLNELVLGM